jgi:hypothetical protein
MPETSKRDAYSPVWARVTGRVAIDAIESVFLKSGDCNGYAGVPTNHDILFRQLYWLRIRPSPRSCIAPKQCFADIDRLPAGASSKLASKLANLPNYARHVVGISLIALYLSSSVTRTRALECRCATVQLCLISSLPVAGGAGAENWG